jgi:hypothetical protein
MDVTLYGINRDELVSNIEALNEVCRAIGGHLQVFGVGGYRTGCAEEAGIDVSGLNFN